MSSRLNAFASTLWLLLATGTLLSGMAANAGPGIAIGGVYSPGGWSTLHRSPANRKLLENAVLAEDYAPWHVLRGASVLTAPTMSPDGGTLYVTTGQAKGASNLHAFGIDGELRWRSEPWTSSDEGVDPCAILSSPIVDVDGNLYLGDCNQLYAYDAEGTIRWVVDLPAPRNGDWIASASLPVNALTTAAFTREGHVFGVTNFGDVVIFDRETGQQLNAPFRLPGHVPPASSVMPMPDSIFGDGLIDPEIRDWAWQLLVGGRLPSANTPAVDLSSGRVYVAATSPTPGRGALFGLDLEVTSDGHAVAVEVRVAFMTEMGPGSGSSPSLSPAMDIVYVSDENGRFYGVDAETGTVRWEVDTLAASAAAAVGANGNIYALQAYGPALVAMSPEGVILWESDLQALADAALPVGWILGEPVAIGNGNPTVVGDEVLVPAIYGYELELAGRTIPFPVRSSLVAVDAESGKGLRNVVELEDDSTGITAVLPDGTLMNSLGTAMTSGVTPLGWVAEWILPGDLEPLLPTGGLQVSRPIRSESALASRLAERTAADQALDATRRPLDVLELAGIEEGMRVADLMAGQGWYAEVLSRAVGPSGQVFAQNNAVSSSRYGEKLAARIEAAGLSQLSSIVVELDALAFEPESLDAVFMVQFYHDTVWMEVDRTEMNRRIFEALRPGGVFLVIDHSAQPGTGATQSESLHRIAKTFVEEEIQAAGFRQTGESDLLANPVDDRGSNVFQESIRGQTDRFLMRFEKPVDGI